MKKNILLYCLGLMTGVFIMLVISTKSGILYKDIVKANYESYEIKSAMIAWDSKNYLEAYRHYKNLNEFYDKDTFLKDDFWSYDYPVRYIILNFIGNEDNSKIGLKIQQHYSSKATESLEKHLKITKEQKK